MSQAATHQEISQTEFIKSESVPIATKTVTDISKNLLAGSAARSIAATLLFPIDVIKTRMQFQHNKSSLMRYHYSNTFDAAKSIIRNEGFLAFYKGLPLRLLYISPSAAVSFTIYENLKKSITGEEGDTADIAPVYFILFGATARIFGTACRTPLDLVKQNLQVENQVKDDKIRKGFINTIRQIYHQNGLRAFWSGYGVTILRDAPFSGLYFVSYEVMKRSLKRVSGFMFEKESVLARDIRNLVSGSMAGMIATCFTIPIDVVKTRLQTQAKLGNKKYKGLTDAFVQIYREEGLRAFRKGLGPRLMYIIPSAGLTFSIYEKLKTFPFFQSFAPRDSTIEAEGLEEEA